MDGGETDDPPVRKVVALSIDYVLKVADIVTQGADGDLVTAVIYLAISRANLRTTFNDVRTARRHAGIPDAPPDEARQPVSVLAIARELELPYETTRRHVGKLVALGLCRRGEDGGVIIPLQVAAGEASNRGLMAIWRLTLFHLCDLADIGVTLPARRRRIAPDIRRIASRVATYHVLDLLHLARARVGLNPQTALLALAIVRANAAELLGSFDPLPDEARRPITTYALARELKMPYETARRQVGWLEEAGFCERRGRGLIIPSGTLRRADLRGAVAETWTQTRAFLTALAELGLGAEEARRWLRRAA